MAAEAAGVVDAVAVEADARNKFLELSRREVLEMVWRNHPRLFPQVSVLLFGQYVSFFGGKVKRTSSLGCPIGSPLSSFIACLMSERAMELTANSFRLMRNRELPISSFVDNTFMVLAAREVNETLEMLAEAGRPLGLIFEVRESHPHQILFLGGKRGNRTTDDWAIKEFQGCAVSDVASGIVDKRGIKLLGAPFGHHTYVGKFLDEKADEIEQSVGRLEALAEPQTTVILTKACILTKINYLLRMTNPVGRDMTAWAKRVDKMVIDAVSRVVKGSQWAPNSKEYQKFYLPSSMGGLGFRENAAFTEAAWLAGVASAAEMMPNMMKPRAFDLQITKYNQRVEGIVVRQKAAQLPTNFHEFMGVVRGYNQVQKELSYPIRGKKFNDLWHRADCKEQDKWELMAQAAPKAMLWLNRRWHGWVADTTKGALCLSNTQYSYLVRRAVRGKNPHNLVWSQGPPA